VVNHRVSNAAPTARRPIAGSKDFDDSTIGSLLWITPSPILSFLACVSPTRMGVATPNRLKVA